MLGYQITRGISASAKHLIPKNKEEKQILPHRKKAIKKPECKNSSGVFFSNQKSV
jgi:hypothetical protein